MIYFGILLSKFLLYRSSDCDVEKMLINQVSQRLMIHDKSVKFQKL
jgi:hypothetical protein